MKASNNAVNRNGGVRIRWLVTFVLDNHHLEFVSVGHRAVQVPAHTHLRILGF
jgi:hypothetical protein